MRVLVTGVGLVGSWVVRHLLDGDHTPVIYDAARPTPWAAEVVPEIVEVPFVQGDVTDFPELLHALRHFRCEAVIHTAALLTEEVRRRPYAGIRVNLLGSVNVLEAARLEGGLRVVFCSSSTAYTGVWERYRDEPVPADFVMRILSDRPRSIYATTKLATEWLGLNYQDARLVDFVAVRFQGVLGPWGGPVSGIPGRILKAIVEPAVRGEPVRLDDPLLLWKGVEEFVHASDAARGAVLAALVVEPRTRVYSIGMGRTYSVDEVLAIAQRIFPNVSFEVLAQPAGGIAGYPQVRQQVCDPEAASRELGYAPQFDMESAVQDYADWYSKRLRIAV
jgi:UDP-glucose 4-epimerase